MELKLSKLKELRKKYTTEGLEKIIIRARAAKSEQGDVYPDEIALDQGIFYVDYLIKTDSEYRERLLQK